MDSLPERSAVLAHIKKGRNQVHRSAWDIDDEKQWLQMFDAWGNRADAPHIYVKYCLTCGRFDVEAASPVNETETFIDPEAAGDYYLGQLDEYLIKDDVDANHYAVDDSYRVFE